MLILNWLGLHKRCFHFGRSASFFPSIFNLPSISVGHSPQSLHWFLSGIPFLSIGCSFHHSVSALLAFGFPPNSSLVCHLSSDWFLTHFRQRMPLRLSFLLFPSVTLFSSNCFCFASSYVCLACSRIPLVSGLASFSRPIEFYPSFHQFHSFAHQMVADFRPADTTSRLFSAMFPTVSV